MPWHLPLHGLCGCNWASPLDILRMHWAHPEDSYPFIWHSIKGLHRICLGFPCHLMSAQTHTLAFGHHLAACVLPSSRPFPPSSVHLHSNPLFWSIAATSSHQICQASNPVDQILQKTICCAKSSSYQWPLLYPLQWETVCDNFPSLSFFFFLNPFSCTWGCRTPCSTLQFNICPSTTAALMCEFSSSKATPSASWPTLCCAKHWVSSEPLHLHAGGHNLKRVGK